MEDTIFNVIFESKMTKSCSRFWLVVRDLPTYIQPRQGINLICIERVRGGSIGKNGSVGYGKTRSLVFYRRSFHFIPWEELAATYRSSLAKRRNIRAQDSQSEKPVKIKFRHSSRSDFKRNLPDGYSIWLCWVWRRFQLSPWGNSKLDWRLSM